MKKLIAVILIAFILMAGLAFSAAAQRADKTSSAKAYYGLPAEKPTHKPRKKNKKSKNSVKKVTTNKARAHVRGGWVYRLESSTFRVASLGSRFNIQNSRLLVPEEV